MTFTRRKSGSITVGKNRGPNKNAPTEQQKEVRSRFKTSTIYAKAAIKDPVRKAIYQAAVRGDQTAFNVALRDAFKAPEITHIDTSGYLGREGDTIVINAVDDFRVAFVTVEIFNGAGGYLEGGNAILQENALDWVFTAAAENPLFAGSRIVVKARDLPNNETVKDVLL